METKKRIILDTINYSEGKIDLRKEETTEDKYGFNRFARDSNAAILCFDYLNNKGVLKDIVEYYKETEREGNVLIIDFVLDADKVKPYFDELKSYLTSIGRNPENCTLFKVYEYGTCAYSGCVSLTSLMPTYRDTYGCIGRSFEAGVVQLLNGLDAHTVYEIREKEGEIKAGIKAIELSWNPTPYEEPDIGVIYDEEEEVR